MRLISVIIPTWDRAERLALMLESLRETTPAGAYEALVYSYEAPSPVEKWNRGAAEAAGDWLLLGADDLLFRPGWYYAARSAGGRGYVGLNDGAHPLPHYPEFAAHYLVSRRFVIDHMGGCLVPPCYTTWWFDREIAERAERANCFTWAADALVEHNHPDWGKAKRDRTYKLMEPHRKADERLYFERRVAGFPDNFEAVIS